jgi:hypothetical protein
MSRHGQRVPHYVHLRGQTVDAKPAEFLAFSYADAVQVSARRRLLREIWPGVERGALGRCQDRPSKSEPSLDRVMLAASREG